MSAPEGFSRSKSICSVEYEPQGSQVTTKGIGAFYRMQITGDNICTLFITSSQVLPIKNKQEITGLKLRFEEMEIERPTLDWVNRLWISPHNVTVIEFSTIAMTILSRANVVGLQCVSEYVTEKVIFLSI